MKTVALLTDFGSLDPYVSVIKAVIKTLESNIEFIDISHNVFRHDINQACFILERSFPFFPKGTVFLAVVDPGVGSGRRAIAVKTRNYFFVGPDNGVLSLAAGKDGIEKIIELDNPKYFLADPSSTFHGRDIFAPVAAHICRGIPFSSLGSEREKLKELAFPSAYIKDNCLFARIVYVDSFGNLVTNLPKEMLFAFLGKNEFVAVLCNKKIKLIFNSYSQALDNKLFFIAGGFGYLELSIKNKSASQAFSRKKIVGREILIKRQKSK
ncbi:MAG: SAM-dependent chlorinase/fluorinase [Candidatus Omnitrophica bacterium]|nr:SAM-dependent chlorinase/fluorinase [Candidatus Omnitrophota bacterium]